MNLLGLVLKCAQQHGRVGRHIQIELGGLTLLQAHQLLLELLGQKAGAHGVGALLGGQALDVLALVVGGLHGDGQLGVDLDLGVGRGILEREVMLAEVLDLVLDLLIGGLFAGKLDLDGLVAVQLDLGLALDGEGVGVLLAVLDQAGLLSELRLADREQALFVDGDGGKAVHHFVGDGGADGVLAQRVIDNGTRGLALAEPREVVLVSEFLIRILDTGVDVLGIEGDGHLRAVALKSLNFSFHVAILHRYLLIGAIAHRPVIMAHSTRSIKLRSRVHERTTETQGAARNGTREKHRAACHICLPKRTCSGYHNYV